MIIYGLPDADGNCFILLCEIVNGWPRARWCGFVDTAEARRGTQLYLNHATDFRCAYLLNDNHDLRG